MTPSFAVFDDYADEPGHHPDFLTGLALAARAAVYCPEHFLRGRPEVGPLVRRHVLGSLDLDAAPEHTRASMRLAYREAAAEGRTAFVNLFFDENWDSAFAGRSGPRLVHSLHRPAELTGELGGINAVKKGDAVRVLREVARTDLVAVHTREGLRQALRWLPPEAVVHAGWPAATRAEVTTRFDAARPATGEPHVLMIGEALPYKGIHVLLEALRGGPLLRIAGHLAVGGADWVRATYPDVRVEWEPGWVTPDRMAGMIRDASVIAFPYLGGFHEHGGVSGALVQALSFAKPVIVAPTLARQAPGHPSVLRVGEGDAAGLRAAIDAALRDEADMHRAALGLRSYVLAEHTYEGHVERIADRIDETGGAS